MGDVHDECGVSRAMRSMGQRGTVTRSNEYRSYSEVNRGDSQSEV